MALTQANRFVAVQTPLGTDALVVRSVTCTEQIGRLFQIELDLISADGEIEFEEIIGQGATIRLDGIDQRHQTTANKMDVLERRAKSADEALESLLRLSSGIPDVQHQLGVLKATSDQVFQKTAALETHREMLERALSQSAEVDSLNAELAAAFRGQEEQTRALAAQRAPA